MLKTNSVVGSFTLAGKVDVKQEFLKPGYSAVGILLLDENDKVIDYKYADSSNSFSFENLSSGKYKVWIDQCGLPTVTKIVELSTMNPSISDLVITANNNGISYDEFVTNEEFTQTENLQVFPNPFENVLKFNTTDPSSLVIRDVVGNIVFNENLVQSQSLEVSTQNWATGLYVITVQTKKELYIKKMIKK